VSDGFINRNDGIATVMIARGKVNALNVEVLEDLRRSLAAVEADAATRAVILTGAGKFFSFGFDVPELYPMSQRDFTKFVRQFTDLYTEMFVYPKPLVAALNGHAVAGGCMLALTCDHRVMVSGRATISLNEIGFASSVLAGSVEMLRFATGSANATKILYSGALYSADEAKALGLVDEVVLEDELMPAATKVARDLGNKSQPAFSSIKGLLRNPVAERMRAAEPESIREFVKIWYSEATRKNLQNIVIR
jgi:enoyl-CoA hydratase/carnithine racemase